jgi:hypothetical protein
MIDRKLFFEQIKKSLFGGKFTQSQVAGLDALLDRWDNSGLTDLRYLAYMLATTFHETARTMQPIREYGRGKGMKYGVKTKYGGQVAYGRGFVQLTWAYNYERADKELALGGALLRDFDLALDLKIASRILFEGMQEGWFTGKKLADYITPTKTDFKNARRIINGTDKAATIAGYAEAFWSALKAAAVKLAPATYDQPVFIPAPPIRPPPDIPAPDPAPDLSQPAPSAGFFMRLWEFLKALIDILKKGN